MKHLVEKQDVNSIGFVSHSSASLWPRTWASDSEIGTVGAQAGILDRGWSREHNAHETKGHSGFVRKRARDVSDAATKWVTRGIPKK